jgi:Outer membrane protein beta-barrel domain
MIMNVKKIALALGSALMLSATTLSAQEQPWSFGAKVGGSMSWLQGLGELAPEKLGDQKVSSNASGDLFLTGGFTAGYAFHENVGIGLEVLYTRLGGKLEVTTELSSDATEEQKKGNKPYKEQFLSNNVVVPVMLKLFPMGCDPDEGIFTIDLGVQAVFPLSVDVKHTPRDSKTQVPSEKLEKFKDADGKEFDKSAQVVPMTVDGIAGVSYELPEIGLTIEGRYHFGFMNFFKSDSEAKEYRKGKMALEEDKNVRNHYATLSVGYNFARLLLD